MGFNNSPSRGSKFVMNINSRFSEIVVRQQLIGLLKEEALVDVPLETYFSSVKTWFDALPGKPDDKPRYKDDIPASLFWDDKPKRILLSKYKEYQGQDFIAIGMNYGVLIGKTLVSALGGHEIVCRIIAIRGLEGVLSASYELPDKVLELCESEINALKQAIKLEARTGVIR